MHNQGISRHRPNSRRAPVPGRSNSQTRQPLRSGCRPAPIRPHPQPSIKAKSPAIKANRASSRHPLENFTTLPPPPILSLTFSLQHLAFCSKNPAIVHDQGISRQPVKMLHQPQNRPLPGSADWQSAVSPVGNRPVGTFLDASSGLYHSPRHAFALSPSPIKAKNPAIKAYRASSRQTPNSQEYVPHRAQQYPNPPTAPFRLPPRANPSPTANQGKKPFNRA